MWLLAVIAVVIIGLGALVASDQFGSMPELVDDVPSPRLPAGDFTGKQVTDLRFAAAPRGYAQHEVDALLARVASQLDGESARTRPVTADEVAASAFHVVTRGYHMGQVDVVLERLGAQLHRLEQDATAQPQEPTDTDTAEGGDEPREETRGHLEPSDAE